MFRRFFPCLLVLSIILSACSTPFAAPPTATLAPSATAEPVASPTTEQVRPTQAARPTQAPQPTSVPRPTPPPAPTSVPLAKGLKEVDCLFDIPAGARVTCYSFFVPEQRSATNGRSVELAVAVFASDNPNAAKDPVVYLEGGPGGSALKSLEFVYEDNFVPMLADRDVVIFDQRGTGYSKPSLACDEYTKLAYDTLDDNFTIEEGEKLFVEAILQCRDRLVASGIDLSAYNSLASAADIEDLRKALGYDQWNLYGSSYGTRLALTTMREYPAGIRSVVLDATRSLQSSETSTPADIDRSFEKLFDGCANDTACNKAFPNLRDTFYELVDRLNASPITEEANNPLTGQPLNVLIDGDTLIGLVTQALYSSSIITELPKGIYAASQGLDNSLFIRLAVISVIQNEYISYGMFYSVRCNEEITFDTPAALAAADDNFPQLRGMINLSPYTQICDAWQAGSAPAIENQPVSSDIPALVLAGEYDPATPPNDGREAAKTLANSTFIEFPGLGHAPGFDGGCPQEIALAFLNNPTVAVDQSCVATLDGPNFIGTGGDIVLIPLENSQFGYSSLIPEGWEEISSGIYARSRSSEIAILQLALPLNQQDTLTTLANQLNLEGTPESIKSYQGQTLTWDLYELTLQGAPVDLALAEDGDKTYVVLLISDVVERQILYDQLFVPVLDALKPLN
jgi:pimeloyl-ACP methyl ester carboxylesterase